ncbi:hypothetical protein BGX27_005688 [Mortierella sp. AM989]|nr:hypothetical protein BGX27_005688 [Mortierella sp. AM989]
MADTKQEGLPQVFRSVCKGDPSGAINSTSETVSIKPRFNSKIGEYIILWNDIKMAFKDPLHIRHEGVAIPFLIDEDFEFLKPLQISIHPGVVLDVIIEAPEIDAALESQRITDTPTSALIQSTAMDHRPPSYIESTRSGAPSTVRDSNSGQTQGYYRAPQFRGESLEDTTPIVRGPQFNPHPYNGSNDFYNHTQPVTKRQSNGFIETHGASQSNKQDMAANYNRGLAYYAGRDIPQDFFKAMEWFLIAASQGHVESQNKLQDMWSHPSTQQDCSEALKRYQKAADLGDEVAQCILGFMYQKGYGVARDYSKAFEYYQLSAGQGFAEALADLGDMYREGHGVTQDYSMAFRYYQQSAGQEYISALVVMGYMYRKGYGVAQDYSKAMELFQRAASQGHHDGQNCLGGMYEKGYGVTQDYFKAVQLYQQAANQGSATGQNNLGHMYRKGNGVIQDYSKAIELFRRAAAQGEINSLVQLGHMYHDGEGVAQDYSIAIKLFQQAANQEDGVAQAQVYLGNMYLNSFGVTQDYSIALDWFHQAASKNYPGGQRFLGYMYSHGYGVPMDILTAIDWYSKAANQGDSTAKKELKKLQSRLSSDKGPIRTIQPAVEHSNAVNVQKKERPPTKNWLSKLIKLNKSKTRN